MSGHAVCVLLNRDFIKKLLKCLLMARLCGKIFTKYKYYRSDKFDFYKNLVFEIEFYRVYRRRIMKYGFIKVACATPRLKVADVDYNVSEIASLYQKAVNCGAKIVVFPELCLTGYTAGDLFYHETLLKAAEKGLKAFAEFTVGSGALAFVGLPFNYMGRNYNVAAAVSDGKVLALIPKTFLPNYNEFYEKRQFSPAPEGIFETEIIGQRTLFGKSVIITCDAMPSLRIAAEICEDLWVMNPPSVSHAQAGANVIVNLSASNELIGKADYRRSLVSMQSAKLFCAYLYADAGAGESTTDMVFAGHDIIAENGKILAESKLFEYGITTTEIDVALLEYERTKYASYVEPATEYRIIKADISFAETTLTRKYPSLPFVPEGEGRDARLELILSIQSQALAKRLIHTGAQCAVIGISGGLDSALALLVSVRAKELLAPEQRSKFTVYGITMPCFGTTDRTLRNAKKLTKELGAKCVKISIRTSVNRHLSDIKHPEGTYDITYENAQARERTQVLMDFANGRSGLVIGTGDLSELALGWATYNGDHMSMYGVNCSVPKTLVKHLVSYEATKRGGAAEKTLRDILDTPISPELLPSDGKNITQITEDKVGPYDLHDFFLFCFSRYAFPPEKILYLATATFEGKYDKETVKKWLGVFLKRFFSQQFKRSCVPDGVKIGSVSLSPRADWRMPSDASVAEWLSSMEK